MLGRSPLVLRDCAASGVEGAFRVEVDVDGETVFFESEDSTLVPRPEAFASAFLLPAAARRRRLVVEAELDAAWLSGAKRWGHVVGSWWGYRARAPRSHGAAAARRTPGRETALCFSGGVDSFFTYLRGSVAPSLLVYVQGFDRPLEDDALLPRIRTMLGEVAAARDTKAAILRTNLREHAAFRSVNWERSHGGALACAGHLLPPAIGRLVISATFAGDTPPPWGSHEQLDPLLGRADLEIAHVGSDLRRAEKLEQIAGEPLVQQHLRVCWESAGSTYNCSRCDKCVVTMLVLREAGALDAFAVFDPPGDFVPALERLPRTIYRKTIRALAERTSDALLREALLALDRRSGEHPAYDRG